MWCIGKITQEYRDRMYALIDLYEQDYNKLHPVVCVDEKSKQYLEETRDPLSMKAGSSYKYDYEYRRNGTGNIFVAVEPKGGKRVIKVTDTRTKLDYAYFIKELLEKHYREAKTIRLVTDNLNTHFAASFYEAFPKSQANKLLKRIEFIYTPKHASWLNMAELEINIMDKQCIGGRIATKKQMIKQVGAWTRQRNRQKKTITWSFSKSDADKKLSKHYVA